VGWGKEGGYSNLGVGEKKWSPVRANKQENGSFYSQKIVKLYDLTSLPTVLVSRKMNFLAFLDFSGIIHTNFDAVSNNSELQSCL
jgi:hypothetical protein